MNTHLSELTVIVSVGTGVGPQKPSFGNLWKRLITHLIDSSTDSEAIHQEVRSTLIPQVGGPHAYYFRLQHHLDEEYPLDNTEHLTQMDQLGWPPNAPSADSILDRLLFVNLG
jgi:hypothetical protein